MYRIHRYSQHSSIICPVWQNGCVLVCEISGCGFGSHCSHNAPVSSKEFLDFQATIECGLSIKRVGYMIETYS